MCAVSAEMSGLEIQNSGKAAVTNSLHTHTDHELVPPKGGVMGAGESRQEISVEEARERALRVRRPIPPVRYDDRLWVASSRAVSSLNTFAPEVLLFQPDARLFCPSGHACPLLKRTSCEHLASSKDQLIDPEGSFSENSMATNFDPSPPTSRPLVSLT